MSKIKSAKINYAIPDEPLTEEEMGDMIRKAENGKFHSIEVLKEKVSKWKIKYSK